MLEREPLLLARLDRRAQRSDLICAFAPQRLQLRSVGRLPWRCERERQQREDSGGAAYLRVQRAHQAARRLDAAWRNVKNRITTSRAHATPNKTAQASTDVGIDRERNVSKQRQTKVEQVAEVVRW